MYKRYFKRVFDLLLSLTLLIVLLPIIISTGTLLFVFNSRKVFFKQSRPGVNEKIFTLIKFKTMNDKTDENGDLLSDEDRLTVIGNWVRKLSLDELPQLINVLKGDMSLIGPRPWLIEYLPLYNDFQRRRHEVLPGITGWAQVNGRNTLGWEGRFNYDVHYVDNVSFLLDLKIVFKTIQNVLLAKGVSAQGVVTMKKFLGNG